jgi:hypothetical protein
LNFAEEIFRRFPIAGIKEIWENLTLFINPVRSGGKWGNTVDCRNGKTGLNGRNGGKNPIPIKPRNP